MTERILIVHNYYRHRGGEDAVVESEIELLRSRGHTIETYFRSNDDVVDMSPLALAKQTLWSTRTVNEVTRLINRFHPDVIHVHNAFPLISPSLFWAAAESRVPIVQTLHNFRLLCPQAMFLRKGRICEDCLGHLPWRSVVHRCYRNSAAQSAVLAGMLALHRGLDTWRNKITRYIALNAFCRNKFIEGGLPAELIVIKPNFVDFREVSQAERSGFLFVGRLSPEKGVEILARAASTVTNARVSVVGAGSEQAKLAEVPGIDCLGALPPAQVRKKMGQAVALLFPSIWYETFGLVALEALATGTPVIASRIGTIPDLVEDGVTGLLFAPGDAADLANKMRWALQNPEEMAAMGRLGRARYEKKYTAERNYEWLVGIYRDAIDDVEKGKN